MNYSRHIIENEWRSGGKMINTIPLKNNDKELNDIPKSGFEAIVIYKDGEDPRNNEILWKRFYDEFPEKDEYPTYYSYKGYKTTSKRKPFKKTVVRFQYIEGYFYAFFEEDEDDISLYH